MIDQTPIPFVAVIIVNWNQPQYTIACLDSLKQSTYPRYRVAVVDNGSQDDSPQLIRSAVPDVDVIENSQNLGFSAAVNVGIRRALEWGAEYILLLNNDTVVAPDFLEPLVNFCEMNPQAGIVGTTVYYFGTDRPFSSGGWPRRFLSLLPIDFIPQGIGDAAPQELGYIWGQALLIRRAVLESIGEFDSAFFMYYEDCDFCLRAAQAGFRLFYVPQSRVWHRIGASTQGGAWQRWRYKISSMQHFYRKYARFGVFQAALQTALTLVGIVIREVRRGNWRWVLYPFSR